MAGASSRQPFLFAGSLSLEPLPDALVPLPSLRLEGEKNPRYDGDPTSGATLTATTKTTTTTTTTTPVTETKEE